MNITVVGSGYVGLVAATCFAETGNQVIGLDINADKIERLSRGIPVIYEPGLEDLLKRNLEEKRLTFTTDSQMAIEQSEIIFIAVGTPPGEDGAADLKYVLAVASQVGQMMKSDKIVVNKSTVPVGTADKVYKAVQTQLKKRKLSLNCEVISNPEFLKEGSAIDDFMKPDRVVIGGASEPAIAVISKLYAPFLRTGNQLFVMDNKSAEVTKYAANALLATKISFMNEMALLCEKVGANVDQVRVGIGSDARIGQKFLFPGIGYGGSCFPKDVKALVKSAHHHGLQLHILQAVEQVNAHQKKFLFEKIRSHYGKRSLKGMNFAVWGLAFKPRTDDMREAPAIEVITSLLNAGANVSAFDPEAMENAKQIWGNQVVFGSNPYNVLEGADALVIHTEWNEFRNPDFERIKKLLRSPVVFDGRNLYPIQDMLAMGFTYSSVGR